jgi:hypothetical protein
MDMFFRHGMFSNMVGPKRKRLAVLPGDPTRYSSRDRLKTQLLAALATTAEGSDPRFLPVVS